VLDEGGDQSLAPTLTPVAFGNVRGIEQHRLFICGLVPRLDSTSPNTVATCVGPFSASKLRGFPPPREDPNSGSL
jgi:hypothetical protein